MYKEWFIRVVTLEKKGAQLMSNNTQLKGCKKVVVFPVEFTVSVNREELELQSILDSNDSILCDFTNLLDYGIGVRVRILSPCSEDGFPIGIKVDGVISIEFGG